jgi:ribonuclease D
MSHHLIDTQKDVDDVCRELADASVIGVDTEFLRVRTYYPRLALVQVSAGDTVHCIDPLASGLSLESLWSLLAAPGIWKVMHAARQDVEVLLHTGGIAPAPLFDTQIAAGLLGFGEQTGYAGLVEAEFAVVLPKGVQRTDWTRRPLSDDQMGYAENDVRYLPPLYERMKARLEGLGRLEWALEDSNRILDPGLYQADPEQAYRRVGRGAHLKPRAQHGLKQLCTWREQTARERDLPRHWVLDDETLASIAASQPRSIDELTQVAGMRPDVVRRDGRAIVDCLEKPVAAVERLWSKRESLSDEQKALRTRLIELLRTRAEKLGIAEAVLATRSDVEKLVRGNRPEEVILGWRWEAVGRAMQDMLSGAGRLSGSAGGN